jgi:2,4-dienoyl-CoA reductase (NADPH2)
MHDPLFTPVRLGSLELPNRIYMPAMHLNLAEEFQVTDPLVAFYAERARGGVGMISVGYATVDELSASGTFIGAHDDAFLPGLTRLADAIRAGGAKSAVQLNHAGRYNHSLFLNGRQPVAPSAIASRLTHEEPRALEQDEILEIIQAFGRAAARVKQAGFDAVEVLSGTGYLISEFLSPLTNRRQDQWGGPLEHRMRFGLEVMAAVRAAVGPGTPLIVRMNGNDFMSHGQDPEELKVYARALQQAGVDALCVNVGWHEARMPQIVGSVPRGAFAYLARGMRDAVSIPVIASHRINDPDTARGLIADGWCDLVAMGRALIADPQLPNKARQGREAAIVHCVACAQGCFDHIFELRPVECLCNPRAGHEAEGPVTPAARPLKVLVVGGGAAGLAAALAAHARGHRVMLCERGERLGGQLWLAGAPPGREEFRRLAEDLARQVALAGIPLRLGCEVDEAYLASERPDAVILASGALPITPPIPGADLPQVVQAWEVLSGRAFTGPRVVVIGGGAVGVETALFVAERATLPAEALKFLLVNRAARPEQLLDLAARSRKTVSVVEMIDRVGADLGKSTRWVMLQDLARLGVTPWTGATAREITASGVKIEREGVEELIPADTVVLAAGAKPFNPLRDPLTRLGIRFQAVGDADRIGTAFDAIRAGHAAGSTLS